MAIDRQTDDITTWIGVYIVCHAQHDCYSLRYVKREITTWIGVYIVCLVQHDCYSLRYVKREITTSKEINKYEIGTDIHIEDKISDEPPASGRCSRCCFGGSELSYVFLDQSGGTKVPVSTFHVVDGSVDPSCFTNMGQ